MSNWNPDIRTTNNLLRRDWLVTPTTGQTVIAPAGAGIIRASLVGAGGWRSGGAAGAGAAFARVTTTCTPGESFTAKIGNTANSLDGGSAAGDTELLRTSGSVQIALAKRGGTNPGLASASVGDLKRDGEAALAGTSGDIGIGDVFSYYPGGCPGDLEDDFSLGIGGPRAILGYGVYTIGAHAGCGGVGVTNVYRNIGATFFRQSWNNPGHGLMCVEFYRTNPGYGA